MDILIYDCEIIKCIPEKTGNNDPRYQYCGGWRDFQNMGLSVIGTGSLNGYFYAHENLTDFIQEANEYDLIVGFNSKAFDDNLLRANGARFSTDYDLLEEIRLAAYGSTSWQGQPRGYSYSLDALAKANGMAKTGHGALAPKLWQDGKHQEVIDYCLNDVRLTADLLKLGLEGKLIDPNTQSKIKLRPLEDCQFDDIPF